jgi:hypothetical protein
VSDPGSPAWHDQRELERLRHEHKAREDSIRSLGGICLVGTVLMVAAIVIVVLRLRPDQFSFDAGNVARMLLVACAIALQGWVGIGLYRLNPKVAGPAVLVFVPLLLAFPLGTLIGGYGLYALLTEKGRRILSPEWKAIVAAVDGSRSP